MRTRYVPVSSTLLILFALSVVVTQAPFFRARRLISDDGGGRSTARSKNAAACGCDYSNGKWVRNGATDDEDCPFLDPGFRCVQNGRNDSSFRHWCRQSRRGSCHLPKFNATDMLERSRNGRIVFVGDSIGRNQWESMLCMLAAAVPSGSRIYGQFGKPLRRHKGYLSMVFADYNLSVEYYRAPMLVMVDLLLPASDGTIRRVIRLDALPRHAACWAGADMLILNMGHWWNLHKTIKSYANLLVIALHIYIVMTMINYLTRAVIHNGRGNYFTVGSQFNVTMDIKEAFRESLQSVKDWALTNPRLSKSSYIFFRSYSPSHYDNMTWDTGGSCVDQWDPVTMMTSESDQQEHLWINTMISSAAWSMRRRHRMSKEAVFLNITYMTGLRRDGHPLRHREPETPSDAPEDCSHWCLPGVPDTWNQMMYGFLVSMGFDMTSIKR